MGCIVDPSTLQVSIDGVNIPLKVYSANPLILTADPYVLSVPPASGRTFKFKVTPVGGLQLTNGNGQNTCLALPGTFADNIDHIEVATPGNNPRFCLAGRDKTITILPPGQYNYWIKDGIKYKGKELNGCSFEIHIPVQSANIQTCNVSAETLILYVDNQIVPLVRTNQFSPKDFSPADSNFHIAVDGNVGRTVALWVAGKGITLFDKHPNAPNAPCTGGSSALDFFRWASNISPYEVTCTNDNAGYLTIPPGPDTNNLSMLLYYGAQNVGTGVNSECEFAIRIPVKRIKAATKCAIMCATQSLELPATRVQALINDVGYQYNLDRDYFTECASAGSGAAANLALAEKIKQIILQNMGKCDDPGVRVELKLRNTQTGPGDKNCLTLTIYNSPIKFNYLKANYEYLPFSRCTPA